MFLYRFWHLNFSPHLSCCLGDFLLWQYIRLSTIFFISLYLLLFPFILKTLDIFSSPPLGTACLMNTGQDSQYSNIKTLSGSISQKKKPKKPKTNLPAWSLLILVAHSTELFSSRLGGFLCQVLKQRVYVIVLAQRCWDHGMCVRRDIHIKFLTVWTPNTFTVKICFFYNS